MQRNNIIITIALTAVACGCWGVFSVIPSCAGLRGLPGTLIQYPEIQIPMAITFSAVAAFGWLLTWLGHRHGDRETRCRQCGHVLRGLSEPRCPECGERI